MSGAFGALGADFSSLSTNPAGIGLYRTSEFVLTPQLYFASVDATYQNSLRNDQKENFNFSNIGLVLTQDIPDRLNKGGWKYIQFGVGMNRLKNFNYRTIMEGVNSQNTMGEYFADIANNSGLSYSVIENDEFDEFPYLNPAWWSYAIDTLPGGGGNQYVSRSADAPYNQKQINHTWGSMNEISFSFGANYNDKLFLGASLGFPYIRYYQERSYTETNTAQGIDEVSYRRFQVNDELITKGTGFNLKLGLIYKPVQWLRIGGAVHTPTWYSNMTDELVVDMNTSYDTPDSEGNYDYYASFPYYSNSAIYEYDLKTPFRAMGNLALFFGPFGLLSVDYEFIDYSTAKLRGYDYDFDMENQAIANKYIATHNFKFGTEWRYTNFAFRGGYAIYQSPFSNNINDGAQTYYSAGIGYRIDNFFLDFAWLHMTEKEDYYLYGNQDIQVAAANIDYNTNRFMLTLGF
ncbi:MAG: outer membrane protein transport protein, partial [Bacteroidales bacterium]|nr:outer membrane protein transport protein [Bacteroidales bacterium]